MTKLTILRAIPGAGKTFLVKPLEAAGTVVASADRYPNLYGVDPESGAVTYDVTLADPAHASSYRTAIEALQNGQDCVVDNTNLSMEEVVPYVAIAQAFRADCEIVTLNVDPEVAFNRNTHGVPFAVIRNSESGEIRKTFTFGDLRCAEHESIVGGYVNMIDSFRDFQAPFHWQFLPWLETSEQTPE
jgi:predicted kinase